MEVILLERVAKLGQMGEVVKVRPGFARNYLLPQKKALRATKENLAFFEGQRSKLEARNLELRKDAEVVAKSLNGMAVVITRQAGETGVLYGSVTPRDVAEAVTNAGVSVDRRQVSIENPIKTLGLFQVDVVLHPEVVVPVTVNVARSEDEAVLQAQRGGMVSRLDEEEDEDEEEVSTEEASTEGTEGETQA